MCGGEGVGGGGLVIWDWLCGGVSRNIGQNRSADFQTVPSLYEKTELVLWGEGVSDFNVLSTTQGNLSTW